MTTYYKGIIHNFSTIISLINYIRRIVKMHWGPKTKIKEQYTIYKAQLSQGGGASIFNDLH